MATVHIVVKKSKNYLLLHSCLTSRKCNNCW